MKKVDWLYITEKYSNTRYKLGSWNRHRGLDCLSLMVLFLDEIHGDIKDKFFEDEYFFEYQGKKINKDNYYKIFKTEKNIIECLNEFVRQTFKKINKLERGCVILNSYKDDLFPFIYIGRGKIVMMNPVYGFNLVNVSQKNIKGIYKW